MPSMSALYGDIGFGDAVQQGRGATRMQQAAVALGLAPEAYDDYPAGINARGARHVTVSLSGPTERVDQASSELQTWLSRNGYIDGLFGTAWLRDVYDGGGGAGA